MNAVSFLQADARFSRLPVDGGRKVAQSQNGQVHDQAVALAAAVRTGSVDARQSGRGVVGIELTPPMTAASVRTLKALHETLAAAVAPGDAPQSTSVSTVEKGEKAQSPEGGLFGNSAVDDGFDVLIALTTTLRATSVAFQKMGANMSMVELKVTKEQADQIVQQGEDALEGAISGAVLQGALSVGGAMQEFKGLKTNEMSLSEEVGRSSALEEEALGAEHGLIGPRQDEPDEVRGARLSATEESPEMALDATESLADTRPEAARQDVKDREVAARDEQARAENVEAEQHMFDVDASPSEPTWRHSQDVAKVTGKVRSEAKGHQVDHEHNYIKMRRFDVRARLMTAVGEMTSRVASASAELAKSKARSEETLDGRFAELWGKLADVHRDSAQKTRSVEDDLLAAVKALMNQEAELGSVVASKVV